MTKKKIKKELRECEDNFSYISDEYEYVDNMKRIKKLEKKLKKKG